MKHYIRFFLFLLVLTLPAAAQTRMAGQVVEVLNGKTVVIEVDGRRITAELQYVEVPETEQPLYATVRDHLEKLTLGKAVEFRPQGFSAGKAFGRLFIGTADVAVQMLRDGAAWHVSSNITGQEPEENAAYKEHEDQARKEQRGVWGVKGLQPAWEFRAAKFERARQSRIAAEQAALLSRAGSEAPVAKAAPRTFGEWGDVNPWLQNPGPLVHGYNAVSRTGYVSTSLMGIKEAENQATGSKTAVDITYIYKQDDKKRTGVFVLTVMSAANEWRFLKKNDLSVTVDEKKFVIGKPKRTASMEDGAAVEKLAYEVSQATLEKIANGGEVVIHVGDFMIQPRGVMQLMLYNMLQVAE